MGALCSKPNAPGFLADLPCDNVIQQVTLLTEQVFFSQPKSSVCGQLEALPFMANSFDIALMPHVLEYASEPWQVLDEYYRVLKPDGYLIILGFNPWGVLGWRRLLPWLRHNYPECGHFIPRRHVEAWGRSLNCKLTESSAFGFPLPHCLGRWPRLRQRWERLGQLCMPAFSGGYVLVIQKKVVPLTLVKARWQKKAVVAARVC